MSKVVYLTDEQIDQLLTIASRIDVFGHKGDAAMLRNMVEVEE